MKAYQYLLFFCLAWLTSTSFALEGWNITDDGNVRTYVPNDLSGEKIFTYIATGPHELNGKDLKQWFSSKAQQAQNLLGKPLKPWTMIPENEDWVIHNQYIDKKSGNTLSVGHQGGMLDNKRAYFISMISSDDLLLILKYGMAFESVLNDVKQHLYGKSSVSGKRTASTQQTENKNKKQKPTVQDDKPKRTEDMVRVDPGKGADMDDIEHIWVRSYIDVLFGGMGVHTHLLFEDGTAYKDCLIPPDELDVATSKRLEPDKWTNWRKRWGTYQLKDKKNNDWIDLKGTPGIKAPEGTEISGKFFNAGGSENRGSWKKHIIFHDDGRFEMDSFAMQSNTTVGGGVTSPLITSTHSSDKHGSSAETSITGENIGGGASNRYNDGAQNTGRYEVKDYTITMVHDNGYTHTELFLYEKRKKEITIVYGDDLYWFDD